MPGAPCNIHDKFGKIDMGAGAPAIKFTIRTDSKRTPWTLRLALTVIAGTALVVVALQIAQLA